MKVYSKPTSKKVILGLTPSKHLLIDAYDPAHHIFVEAITFRGKDPKHSKPSVSRPIHHHSFLLLAYLTHALTLALFFKVSVKLKTLFFTPNRP